MVYKKISLVLAGLLLTGFLFGQEDERKWRKRVASPTYGIGFLVLDINYRDRGDNFQHEGMAMPGIDLRHFNGVNATEGGGFYYGYEIGAAFNFLVGKRSFDVLPGETVYELDNGTAYNLFLMGKHGYRFNLSDDSNGISFGFELGLGVNAGGAELNFVETSHENNIKHRMDGGGVSPQLEIGVETGFQLKETNRMSARFAVSIGDRFINVGMGDAGMPQFGAELAPVHINLRFGFRFMH